MYIIIHTHTHTHTTKDLIPHAATKMWYSHKKKLLESYSEQTYYFTYNSILQ